MKRRYKGINNVEEGEMKEDGSLGGKRVRGDTEDSVGRRKRIKYELK